MTSLNGENHRTCGFFLVVQLYFVVLNVWFRLLNVVPCVQLNAALVQQGKCYNVLWFLICKFFSTSSFHACRCRQLCIHAGSIKLNILLFLCYFQVHSNFVCSVYVIWMIETLAQVLHSCTVYIPKFLVPNACMFLAPGTT